MSDWMKRRAESNTDESFQYYVGWENGRSDLLREIEPLIEALRFYADDKANSTRQGTDIEFQSGYFVEYASNWSDPIGRFVNDEGNKARLALADWEKMRGGG